MSGVVMEAPAGCRRGRGPSGWCLSPSGKPCGMGQNTVLFSIAVLHFKNIEILPVSLLLGVFNSVAAMLHKGSWY